MTFRPIRRNEFLLPWLAEHQLSLDRRLTQCLELVASQTLDDNHIVQGLIELNAGVVGRLDLRLPDRSDRAINWFPYYATQRTGCFRHRLLVPRF
jgi:hypothetical protein